MTEKKKPTQETILEEAQTLIWGDREKDYGTPNSSLSTIGYLWSAYLDNRPGFGPENSDVPPHNLTATDVAFLMTLLKIARGIPGAHINQVKRDTVTDGAGYLGLIERIGGLKDE